MTYRPIYPAFSAAASFAAVLPRAEEAYAVDHRKYRLKHIKNVFIVLDINDIRMSGAVLMGII